MELYEDANVMTFKARRPYVQENTAGSSHKVAVGMPDPRLGSEFGKQQRRKGMIGSHYSRKPCLRV